MWTMFMNDFSIKEMIFMLYVIRVPKTIVLGTTNKGNDI